METVQRAYEDFDEFERKEFAEACMVHGYREIDFLVFDYGNASGRRVKVQKGLVVRLYDGDHWMVPFTADLMNGAFDRE
jgi:hypothetical protein